MTVCRRATLVLLVALLGFRPAQASEITISEISESGGTIINDGSADVASSNGSSRGLTSLMSQLGLSDLTLAADLASLQILGLITDPVLQGSLPATSANLSSLRIFGTVATPCVDCATLTGVGVGGSLSLRLDSNGNPINPANVLFAFNIVGGPLLNMPWGVTPGGIQSPLNQPLDTPLDFQLSTDQINFILQRMQGYSVGDIRIGLGALANGVNGTSTGEPVLTQFQIQAVPEPGSLLLLGTGLVGLAAAMRRLRRMSRH